MSSGTKKQNEREERRDEAEAPAPDTTRNDDDKAPEPPTSPDRRGLRPNEELC
jgi:hypothetical protein